jgi:hypothetical protein
MEEENVGSHGLVTDRRARGRKEKSNPHPKIEARIFSDPE